MKRPPIQLDRDLVAGFGRWLIYVGIGLNLIVWGFAAVRCQEVHQPHPSQEDYEETISVKLVTITSWDDRLVTWKKESTRTIRLGSFAYDAKSLTGFPKKETGCRWMIYCKAHDWLYFMAPCKGGP